MPRYELTIWDPPTPQGRKRVAMKAGGGKTFYPEVKDAKAIDRIRSAWIEKFGEPGPENPNRPLTGPLVFLLDFYIKAPSGLAKWKRDAYYKMPVVETKPDWDNAGKQVGDALNGYAWVDDRQIALAVVSKFYALYPDGTDEAPHITLSVQSIEVAKPVKEDGRRPTLPTHPWRKKADGQQA